MFFLFQYEFVLVFVIIYLIVIQQRETLEIEICFESILAEMLLLRCANQLWLKSQCTCTDTYI